MIPLENESLHVLFKTLFDGDNTVFKHAAETWERAVRAVGGLLAARGSVTPGYVESMVRAVLEMGPYMVIAPGIALAHARPDESVLRDDLALATLAKPVAFGNAANDPVTLVFAFCALDADAHILQLQRLAEALSNDAFVRRLNEAESIDDLYNER